MCLMSREGQKKPLPLAKKYGDSSTPQAFSFMPLGDDGLAVERFKLMPCPRHAGQDVGRRDVSTLFEERIAQRSRLTCSP